MDKGTDNGQFNKKVFIQHQTSPIEEEAKTK